MSVAGMLCSTPFGIYEVGTYRRMWITLSAGSAQRLSASMRLARWYKDPQEVARMCSTPFGIYEVGTHRETIKHAIGQKCSTPFGIYEVGTAIFRKLENDQKRAQRLSASMRLAPAYPGVPTSRTSVLNAFRHL